MGLFDRFRSRFASPAPVGAEITFADVAVGANSSDGSISSTYSDKNITFTGEVTGLDYATILRDKQANINSLYQLSDYYVDADPIYRGIIKEVYTPFSIVDDYRLVGANESVKKKYEDYYERINLRNVMESVFLSYYKYANVYIYLMPDGRIITLPPHLIRISNVTVGTQPVLEFNCGELRNNTRIQTGSVYKDYVQDQEMEVKLEGYPEEVSVGLNSNVDWVQLNPANTYVMQDTKEDWTRYAIPMISACLKPLKKKELISNWEDSGLQLGMHSFLHVKYGDKDEKVAPNRDQLTTLFNLFRTAMTSSASLAVTNSWCESKFIQPDLKDLFEYDKYRGVNADILSAGGVSGTIVSGRNETGASFGTSQISVKTAAIRIQKGKNQFCDIMNRINARLNSSASKVIPHAADKNVPKFEFPPVDLASSGAFQDACMKLWEKGVLSDRTLLTTYGYDVGQEVERKTNEQKDGTAETLMPKALKESKDTDTSTEAKERGRPKLSDNERTSDPGNAETGAQPKPSAPDQGQ